MEQIPFRKLISTGAAMPINVPTKIEVQGRVCVCVCVRVYARARVGEGGGLDLTAVNLCACHFDTWLPEPDTAECAGSRSVSCLVACNLNPYVCGKMHFFKIFDKCTCSTISLEDSITI